MRDGNVAGVSKMIARQQISKKLRFEVFKRDSFSCQYCGRRAPDVVLQCDHIKPVVDGGSNDILNLTTSCVDCNAGKGARSLSEQAALSKQLDQLEQLQARREQIEMLIEWREALSNLDDEVVGRIEEHWKRITENTVSLNSHGRDGLKKLVKRHGVDLVLRAMQESGISYLKRGEDQKFTFESCEKAFQAIGAVANVLKRSADNPHLRQLYYIRGILRNRLNYLNEYEAMALMERAVELDIDVDWLTDFSKRVRNWSTFRSSLEEFITRQEQGGENGSN